MTYIYQSVNITVWRVIVHFILPRNDTMTRNPTMAYFPFSQNTATPNTLPLDNKKIEPMTRELPFGIKIAKGFTYNSVTWDFVDFAINSEVGKQFLGWLMN